MTTLDYGSISVLLSREVQTSTYSSLDWDRLSRYWKLTLYTVHPETNQPLDKPSETYSYDQEQPRPWDEVMEEVLQDRAEAWDRLALL